MTASKSPHGDDPDVTHASVIERYSGLAQAAHEGQRLTGCRDATNGEARLGPAACDSETDGLHSAIVHAGKPAASGIRIAAMTAAHAEKVLEIYQLGIDEGDATFETTAPAWESFDASKLPDQRFVAVDRATDRVVGWVAAGAVSARCVYAGVVEHSVYVHPEARGRGVGRALLDTLIASTESAGIWTIQSGIFPENTASLALHAAAGFRTVGIRERIGCHHGVWRDVVMIERRSRRTGTAGDPEAH